MSEKKVIVVIVEGPSDENAIGGILKEYFSSEEVQSAGVGVAEKVCAFLMLIPSAYMQASPVSTFVQISIYGVAFAILVKKSRKKQLQ